ncbi:hypothetical protein KM043_010641 [Ampulex compressa]|nr:hypothetical protein KM043_010641 [Ampulex compressa]
MGGITRGSTARCGEFFMEYVPSVFRLKLKSISAFPSQVRDIESTEASITAHFARLHGVLQNIEKNTIEKLYQQGSHAQKNLQDIAQQLKEEEDRLQSAMVSSTTVKEILDKVYLEDITDQLKKLADVPCHLVQDPVSDDKTIAFHVDSGIIAALEEHCTIQVPTLSGFNLLRTEVLPDDYEIEPLNRELDVSATSNKSSATTPSPKPSSLPIRQAKSMLAIGTSECVHVTHVVDPSCFYVQKIQCQKKILELEKGLTVQANGAKVPPTNIALNKLYTVQRAEDEKWCRGRVIGVNKKAENAEPTYDIFFVDYGTKDNDVPVWRMRNILPQFSSLPMMAVKCSLYDVVPYNGKWQKDAVDYFNKLISSNSSISMQLIVQCGDTYYVDLCTISLHDRGPTSITDALVCLKYAGFETAHKFRRMNPRAVLKFFKERLELEVYTDVAVQSVVSPDCIYVEKVKRDCTSFYKLIHTMTKEYDEDRSSATRLHVPEKGIPCAAQGANGNWYRAMITDVPSEDKAEVFYVDMGYTAVLSHDQIRTLSEKYMAYTTQTIEISLRNIKPLAEDNNRWSNGAIEFMKNFFRKNDTLKVVPFEKLEDTYSVQLYDLKKNNLGSLLVKNDLALYINPRYNSGKQHRKHPRAIKEESHTSKKRDDNVAVPEVSKEVLDPFKVSVLVYSATSPDCIYVSDATRQEAHIDMMAQLQEFYNKYRAEQRDVWEPDTVCAIYSTKDKAYCRAKVLRSNPPDEVDVFYYDMGLEETVKTRNLQPLYMKFSEVPAYVFKVKLAGILPCGGSKQWPSLSCEELSGILEDTRNCKFYISKIEDVEDTAIPVELWVKQSKTDGPLAPTRIETNSVNRMLVEKGVALPIKDYALKRDKILAVELKRELRKRSRTFGGGEKNVKWFATGNESDCPSLTMPDYEDLSKASVYSSDSDSDYGDEEDVSRLLFLEQIPLPPKLSSWIPPTVIMDDRFTGISTYVDHDANIYLHSKEHNESLLRYIESELEQYYRKYRIKECDKSWSVGDLCIAQYHVNKKWYRGRVKDVLENGTIQVEFVDYGNVEECEIGTLAKKVILGHIPIQCTVCRVHGLTSGHPDGKWRIPDLDLIHAIVTNQECKITILNRNAADMTVSVTIFKPEQCDLVEFLVKRYDVNIKPNVDSPNYSESNSDTLNIDAPVSGTDLKADTFSEVLQQTLAIMRNSDELKADDINGDDIISGNSVEFKQTFVDAHDPGTDELESVSSLNTSTAHQQLISSTPQSESTENLASSYKSISIPIDVAYLNVDITCLFANTEFYAHLKENEHCPTLNQLRVLYENVMRDIQENVCRQPLIDTFVPGTVCCTKYTDDSWYRCIIVDSENGSTDKDILIKLLYVDFGNDEYKTIRDEDHDLHSMKEEWLLAPTMAIKCKLWGIEVDPEINFATLIPKLQKIYDRKAVAVVKKLCNEYVNVELYTDERCRDLLYESLIKEGLYRTIEPIQD